MQPQPPQQCGDWQGITGTQLHTHLTRHSPAHANRLTLQVAYELGRASYAQLQGLGADVEFITYRGMGHSVS